MDEAEDDLCGAAVQSRCVHCKREQYKPAVIAVSCGDAPCAWCNALSRRMTIEEYRAALAAPNDP